MVVESLSWLIKLVKDNIVLCSFVLSMVSNSIPYVGVPYLIVIATMGASAPSLLEKIAIGLSAGVGAAIGKVVVYGVGRGVHAVLPGDVKKNLELFSKLFRRSVFIAIVVFAASPLPDDLLYVPLGVAKYNLPQFFIAVCIGKIILSTLVVMLGSVAAAAMEQTGLSRVHSVLLLVVLSIVVTIVIARVDWGRVMEAYTKGATTAAKTLVQEIVRALLPRRRGV